MAAHRLQTFVILFALLLIAISSQTFAQKNELNKGNCWLEFVYRAGCISQIQSFNKNISKNDLDKLIPILINFPSDPSHPRGLMYEFTPFSAFTSELSYDSLKEKLVSYCEQGISYFDARIARLQKYEPPLPSFIEIREKLVENFKSRQTFNRIALSYLKTGDVQKFKNDVINIYSDSLILSTFNKIETEKSFRNKMYYLPSDIYNEFNQNVFPLLPIEMHEQKLLKQNNIRIIVEECAD